MRVPSPIDYVGLRKALIAVVMAATGLGQNQVVMAEPEAPGAPRPKRPFVTLKILNAAAKYGDDVLEPIEGSDRFSLSGVRRVNLDVNAFGQSHEDAYEILATLQAQTMSADVVDGLAVQGIGIWDTGSINDLSFLMTTGYEGRCQMEWILGVVSNMTIDPGTIGSVEVLGTVEAPPTESIAINVQRT